MNDGPSHGQAMERKDDKIIRPKLCFFGWLGGEMELGCPAADSKSPTCSL
jgi:hypothetical protein